MSDCAPQSTCSDSSSSSSRGGRGGPQTVDLSRLTPEQLVRIVESAEEAVQRRHAAAAAAAATATAVPPRRRGRGRGRARVRVQDTADAGSDAGDERDEGDDDNTEDKEGADEEEEAKGTRADENRDGPLRAWFALARGPRRTVLAALLAVLVAVLFAPYAAAAREHAATLARFVSSGLSTHHTAQ